MSDLIRMAEDYRHYAQKKSNAHYKMSERAKSLNTKLGLPVTVATTIVGTTIFATLNSPEQRLPVQIATGLISLSAAVASALHTFFNFSQAATQHKDAAAEYESVRHELDMFILKNADIQDGEPLKEALAKLEAVSKSLDDIGKRSPSIPDAVYDAAQTRVASRPILSK